MTHQKLRYLTTKDLNNMQAGQAAANAAVADMQSRLNSMQTQMDAMQNAMSGVASSGRMSDLEARMGKAETDISSLKTRTTTLESSVGSVQQTALSLQQAITNLQQSSSSVNQNISSLQQSTSTLQTSVSGLQTSVTGVQQALSTVQQTLAAFKVRRIDVSSVTSNGQGVVTIDFAAGVNLKPLAVLPVLTALDANRLMTINLTESTLTRIRFTILQAKGTLVLSSGMSDPVPNKTLTVILMEPL